MPNCDTRSSVDNDGLQDVSTSLELAADQMAVEKACELIDSYILEFSQEVRGSPALQAAIPRQDVGEALATLLPQSRRLPLPKSIEEHNETSVASSSSSMAG